MTKSKISAKVRRHLTALKHDGVRVPHTALTLAEDFGMSIRRQTKSIHDAAMVCIRLAHTLNKVSA